MYKNIKCLYWRYLYKAFIWFWLVTMATFLLNFINCVEIGILFEIKIYLIICFVLRLKETDLFKTVKVLRMKLLTN